MCGIRKQLASFRPRQRILQAASRLLLEDSGHFSLNLAITLPLMLAILAAGFESAHLLSTKQGVSYAAWVAARSAMVWIPAEFSSNAGTQSNLAMVRRAAVNALTPWASPSAIPPKGSALTDPAGAAAMRLAYRSAALKSHLSDASINRRWNYANAATAVTFDPPIAQLLARSADGPQSVRVTVHYRAPLLGAITGRFLGQPQGSRWYRQISSTVEVRLQQPLTRNGHLGIPYDSRPVR